jgi:hypothetical protein
MITDIPTSDDFHAAGLSQIYLAWQVAMQTVQDYDQATYYKLEEEIDQGDVAEYWRRSQPALANAFSLIQQGVELALKGRIAAISPFLLLGDPADWPGNGGHKDLPFGDFRTLDAKDLVKVHNCIRTPALGDSFQNFWDQLRRDRNKIMHSVTAQSFEPGSLVLTILTAVEELFAEVPWHRRLSDMIADGRYGAFGYGDDNHNIVLGQIDIALKHLKPSDADRFFGFDTKRRSYTCPHCYFESNRDWQDVWPRFAQFPTKEPGATSLSCFLCGKPSEVERIKCQNGDCPGDVLFEGMCLTCLADQDRLPLPEAEQEKRTGDEYEFVMSGADIMPGYEDKPQRDRFTCDTDAKRHAREVLRLGHFGLWDTITVTHISPLVTLAKLPHAGRNLGRWERRDRELIWIAANDGGAADPVD